MSKKVIAISSKVIQVENMPDHMGQIMSYSQAILASGYLPMIVPMMEDKKDMDQILGLADALILAGGSDIHPDLYGEDPHPKLSEVSLKRDLYELQLIQSALDQSMPILGICRGMQLLNVYFGGSLYQDIESQYTDPIGHIGIYTVKDYHHRIKLKKDGYLYKIFNSETIKVSSIHHQAIKDLGQGLKTIAHASDGIIEGIENLDLKIIGTQFHPEEHIGYNEEFKGIFHYLVSMVD